MLHFLDTCGATFPLIGERFSNGYSRLLARSFGRSGLGPRAIYEWRKHGAPGRSAQSPYPVVVSGRLRIPSPSILIIFIWPEVDVDDLSHSLNVHVLS